MPELPKQYTQINAIKPPASGQVDYYGSGKDTGLILRVSHTGRKTWFTRYYTYRREEKVRAKSTIGRFPGIDLEKARKLKRKIEADVDEGKDPAYDEKITKRKSKIKTVEALCKIFFQIREKEYYKGRLRRNIRDEQSMAKCYIYPAIGSYAPHTVTSDDIAHVLTKAQEQCSANRANRILALLRVLFKFALSEKGHKCIDENPALSIPAPGEERAKIIDPPKSSELKELWNLIENGAKPKEGNPVLISPQIQLVLKLLLLTGQRSAEASQAPIDEFDMDDKVWIISGERTKNGKPHKVPLSDTAYELVKEAMALAKKEAPKSKFLFPGWTGRNGLRRGTISIGKTAPHHALKRVTADTKLDRFTVHDFRKICATQMAELGVLMEIVSEILNHSVNTVTARHYAKPSYLPQMRTALELWSNHLMKIVGK